MNTNEEKLHQLPGKFVKDLGAAMHAGAVVTGEKLVIYKAMGRARSAGRFEAKP